MSSLNLDKLKALIQCWSPEAKVVSVDEMNADASGRRYFRVNLSPDTPSLPQSAVLMEFSNLRQPEIGGDGPVVPTDEAVVLLSKYFLEKGVAVPELYFDGRGLELGEVLLIEDLGDLLVGDLLFNEKTEKSLIENIFRLSLEELRKINELEIDKQFFIYNRSFTKEVFVKEMEEFRDYFLPRFSLSTKEINLVDNLFSFISDELIQMPQCLCHRDYHAWNLIYDKMGQVRVIDFQDALVGPRAYDLASLLNDRDVDKQLGRELSLSLVSSYSNLISANNSFLDEYDRCLLQRDLKVVGRFEKLVSNGLEKYSQWVPGTYQRVLKSLKSITSSRGDDVYGEFRNLLEEKVSLG